MRPRTILLSALVLLCALTLSSCISLHPLGMSNSEWKALSPEQKMEAREKQAQLTAQKKQAKEAQKAAENEAIAQRYQNAKYGDIVSIVISGGTMDINGKRHEYEPLAFDLIRGETRNIEIFRKGKRYHKDTAVMRLSSDGRTFYFDDKQRDRLVLVDRAWEEGQTYRINELKNRNTNPRNIEINIRYRPTERKQESVIIIR